MSAYLVYTHQFQSTLPAWGATNADMLISTPSDISIHAPRMGSDLLKIILVSRLVLFQSTLPAWGATAIMQLISASSLFQSTLPAWGATTAHAAGNPSREDFNPRSPHGERHSNMFIAAISIRFQSTLPAWGATILPRILISFVLYFNPRSPHGERLSTAFVFSPT